MKRQEYLRSVTNSYFRRTYDKKEIDLVEEKEGKLFGYEVKWKKERVKIPRDWTNNHLTSQRYKILYEKLDPASIIAEMSDTLNQALVDPQVAAAMLEHFHLFEKGIVWGLMSVIKNIITEVKST